MKPAQVKLGEVANVQLGITLRGVSASRHDPAGTHQLIRIGDISDDGMLRFSGPNLIRLDADTAARFTLHPGEVLLAARGQRMTATVFDFPMPAVVGSQYCVIRPRPDRIISAYLRWYLNLSVIQERLNSLARGTYVRSLPASELAELEIPLPSLPRQHAIAELHELRLRERQLMEALASRRALFVDQALLRSLRQ